VEAGAISFGPVLLEKRELLKDASEFHYLDIDGQRKTAVVPAGGLAFTFCQVPVIYAPGKSKKLEIASSDGRSDSMDGHGLGVDLSRHVFLRDGQVERITVYQPL
jgi:hypothetical protein